MSIKNTKTASYSFVSTFLTVKKSSFFTLNFFLIDYIYDNGCARRGASGALFPKSASCGAESPLKGLNLEAYRPI